MGPLDRRAQDTHGPTPARRGPERVAAGRKRHPIGAFRRDPCNPGWLGRAISSAVYGGLRRGGWPGLGRVRLPLAGAEMITHRDLLPGLREWISPRGYAKLSDDAPPCRGLCSGGLMEGGSIRETGPKGRCDESPPRRKPGQPDRRVAQSSPL